MKQQKQQQQQEPQTYDGYKNNTNNSTSYNDSNSIKRRRKGIQQMWILFSILIIIKSPQANAADLVINVPSASSNDNAFYRIDYSPPFGYPEPNTTIPASDIGKDIQFSHALPGTEYNFWLYYTNSTHRELLTWTVKITTAPDPPANLSVQLRSSKSAFITWKPPGMGAYSGYKIKIFGLTDVGYSRTFSLDSNDTLQLSAKELTPGGTYQVQAYTIYQAKESVAYTSRNFTTSKSRSMGGTRSPNSKCNF